MQKKILIIDDNYVQAETFRYGLEQHDYTVIINHTATKIPDQIEQENPDLVLLDVVYPGVSGLGIAEYLRENDYPFIFISDSDEKSVLKQAYTIGALGFLLIPVTVSQLVVEIETVLHWRTENFQQNRRKELVHAVIENNRKISVAIGIVTERYQINGSDAIVLLRDAAEIKNCRILDIANKLIKSHEKSLSSFTKTVNLILHGHKKSISNKQALSNIIETVSA